MNIVDSKDNTYFSRNRKWLAPLVIFLIFIVSNSLIDIIGEGNVLPTSLSNIIAAIALLICAFNARITQTISARIIVMVGYVIGFGAFGLLLFKIICGDI